MIVETKKVKINGTYEKLYIFYFNTEKEVEKFIVGLELICKDNYVAQKLKKRITDKYCSTRDDIYASTMLYQGELTSFMEMFLEYNQTAINTIQQLLDTINLWKETVKLKNEIIQLYGIDFPSTEELSGETDNEK